MVIYYVTSQEKKFLELKSPWYLLPFRKKVLILGKEWVLNLKKRYPLLSEKEIAKAVSFEITELFPLKNPSYYFFINQKGETFVEITLFAWEKEIEEVFKKEFAYSYLIPEELIFSSKELTLFIVKRGEVFLLVASENFRFLNSLFLKGALSREDLTFFLKTLGEKQTQIKMVKVYGISQKEILTLLPEELKPYVLAERDLFKDLPQYLQNLEFKKFKVKKVLTFDLEKALLQASRLFLMGVIALQAHLMFSYWEYHKNINNLKKMIKELDKEIKASQILPKTGSPQDEEKLKAFEEFKEEFESQKKSTLSNPLFILEEVAKALPDGAKIESFSLREKKLELSVSAKDLFEVLSNLRKNPIFSNLKLASSPYLDTRAQTYTFRLEVELK